MKEATTFQNGISCSYITSRKELIQEINHYKAFWLSSIGNTYSNKKGTIHIKVKDLTGDDRIWISNRMRG